MAHSSVIIATVFIATVGLVSLFLAAVAVQAQRRTGNRRLWYLAAAFFLFTVKSVLTATALWWHTIGHESLEVVASGFDLAIVALLVLPLLR